MLDRRRFLKLSSFFSVSPLALGLSACSDDSNDAPIPATGDRWKFPQSIASADPHPDSIVLWTRVSDSSLGDTDTVGSDTNISIKLHVTSDDNSSLLGGNSALTGTLLADLEVAAYGAYDGTLRHKLTGLSANTTYYYQFVAGQVHSNIGRFKTAPAATDTPEQLRFAFVVCQDWTVNHWAGYEHLVANEDNLDFFVHLGDYIYETVGADFQSGAVESRHTQLTLPDGTTDSSDSSTVYATTVNDYRYLYKTYRTDARLQAMHERFAMIAIWDDHEFSDDCWQDAETYDLGTYDSGTGAGDNTHQTSRRLNANKAWFEFMPADVSYDADSTSINGIQIYRDLQFGTLAHLVMTDERLYRADHIIPEAEVGSKAGSRYFVALDTIEAAEAAKIAAAATNDTLSPVSMLGTTQRAWWKSTLQGSTATWKIWGNEVSLLRMELNGTAAIATLFALNAVSTLASSITSTYNSTNSVPVAAAIVAAVTAGADSATAASAGAAIATALAASSDMSSAAISAGLTTAQAAVAVDAFNTAQTIASAGGSVGTQISAAALAIALDVVKEDILTQGASSSFITSSGMETALASYFANFLLNADQWDGYNAERKNLMSFLKDNNIANVVAVTGDIHAFFAGTVRDDFDTDSGTDVMVDLVSAGMSSDSFFVYWSEAVSSSNSLSSLFYYTLSIDTGTDYGTLSINFNLLDYTLGKASPTVSSLAEQARVRVRSALADAGASESDLDTLTDTVLEALTQNNSFNTTLLTLAQQLSAMNTHPWMRHVNTDAQGYSVVTLTANELSCEFRQVNRLVGTSAPTLNIIANTTTAVVQAGSAAVTIS